MILDTTIWYYFSLDESFSSCEPEGILKMFLNFQQSCAIFSYKLGSYKIKIVLHNATNCNFGKFSVSSV